MKYEDLITLILAVCKLIGKFNVHSVSVKSLFYDVKRVRKYR